MPLGAKTWLTGNKKMGTQSYNCKELNSANNLTEQGNGFFTSVSSKKSSPANILIFAW